jgi:hypothetical protein
MIKFETKSFQPLDHGDFRFIWNFYDVQFLIIMQLVYIKVM